MCFLYFAPRTSYPSIDRMYVMYNFECQNWKATRCAKILLAEGRLAQDEKNLIIKAPTGTSLGL